MRRTPAARRASRRGVCLVFAPWYRAAARAGAARDNGSVPSRSKIHLILPIKW